MMAVKTYYEVRRTVDDSLLPSQRRKYGASGYGYASLPVAQRYCPPGYYVAERHIEGYNDWGGRVVYTNPEIR